MEVDRAQDETPTPGGLEPGASEHSDVIPAGSEPRGQATPEAASTELEPIDDDPDDVDDDLDDSGDGLDDSGADVGADDSLPRLDAESPAAVAMPKTPVRGTALTDARPTDAPHAPAAAHPAAAAPARTAEAPAPAPAGERIPLMGLGARAWKQVTFELLNLPLGIAGFVCMVVLLSVGSGLAITIIGLPLLAIALAVCRAWGRVDRARARALLGLQIASPSKMPVRESGFFGWLWTRLADPVGWRSALYLLIRLPWGILSFTVTLTLLVAFWPVVPYVVYGFAAVDRAMISALLSPSSATERRIRELEARRETMVGAAADDRRRIERDLHDGAQARLVALAMDLGLTKERMAQDPEVAAQMIEQAHGEVKVALRELRDLARGIHPAILTERGLGAALTNVAGRCTVPVTVSVDLPTHRPSAAVEGLVYFTASELLTNISKHSGARAASIRLIRAGDRLQLTVTDDGRGGATIAPGGGLAGLAERVGAMDGRFTLTSPPGGPTVATARLPWQDVGAGPSSSGKEARRAAHEARHERQHERQDARRAAQEARHVQRDAERDAAQRGDA